MKQINEELERRLSKDIAEADYNQRRLSPDVGDDLYLHLSDLLFFLEPYKQEPFSRVLDYGCGGSPYRKLFGEARYDRADYLDTSNLDLIIGSDGKLSSPDAIYDAVLSTQVLEHVFSPAVYLTEAFRVLKPGGKLILTTHGIWEEHGCPYDFRRWTADGLRMECESAGFKVTRLVKLTTGPRAILFLFSQIYKDLWSSRKGLLGWAWWLLQRSAFGVPGRRHRWIDQEYPKNRMVSPETPGHETYLALGVEAVKEA